MSPPPVRVRDERQLRCHRANTAAAISSAGWETSRCASPPFGGHHPDVAARDEGDLRTRGAQRRFGKIRHARTKCGRGKRKQNEGGSHKSWRPLYCIALGPRAIWRYSARFGSELSASIR